MLEQVLTIWAKGGWVMWPLLAVALWMSWVGLRLWFWLRRAPDRLGSDANWRRWIERPERAAPAARPILAYLSQGDSHPRRLSLRVTEVASGVLPVVDRQLAMLSTAVAAAPLVGLLGTVFGMLVTFQALALGGGGGQVTEAMAAGISQALFPPEVGLCIALPGLVLVNLARRRRQEIEAFFAQLESLMVQRSLHGGRRAAVQPPTADLEAAAMPRLETTPALA